MKDNFITLDEFADISGLSDAAIGRLLREYRLPCIVDEERGILLNMSDLKVEKIVAGLLVSDKTELGLQRVQLKEKFRARLLALWEELEQEFSNG